LLGIVCLSGCILGRYRIVAPVVAGSSPVAHPPSCKLIQANSRRWAVYLLAADNCFSPKTRYNPPITPPCKGGYAMIPPLFFYQLAILGLLWLCVMLHLAWPSRGPVPARRPVEPETPVKSRRTRSHEPKPFVGLTHKPPCALCEHEASHPTPPPPRRPAPMPPTTRRPREVNTSRHCCPHATCAYRGWVGVGNLRANGHPSGGPWRQFYCTACEGYFLETHGTLFHGKRMAVELIVHVLACVAEGLGIRSTARVCEVDSNTVLR
jgi:hypothetical protein